MIDDVLERWKARQAGKPETPAEREARRLAALVYALGYPDDHKGEMVRRDEVWRKKRLPPALRILNAAGRAVALFDQKKLTEACSDVHVQQAFLERFPPEVSETPAPPPTPPASEGT